jgi:hypothetical protein
LGAGDTKRVHGQRSQRIPGCPSLITIAHSGVPLLADSGTPG